MACPTVRSQLPKSLFVALLLGMISTSGVVAAEPLAWKFKPGDVYNYQLVQKMNMTMNLGPGGETIASVNQTIDIQWKVQSVEEDGAAELEQRFDRVQMDITAPGQPPVHFDTASDEPPQGYAAMLAPALVALKNSPFHLTMTPRGEITKVEIAASVIEALNQGSGAAMLGGLATEAGLKSMVRQNAVMLPAPDELTEGHQWTTSSEVDNPTTGNIETETTYRSVGSREVDGQQLEVFVPTILTKFAATESANGAKVTVENQESTGEILFNRSAGRLESTAIEQRLDLVITVGGNTINQRLDQSISFKFIPADDVEE